MLTPAVAAADPIRSAQQGILRLGRLASAPAVGLGGLGLGLLSVLSAYAFRGWFARYTADDYCTAGIQRAVGFVQAQAYWYESWSGRFTYYAVVGLVELAGTKVVQVLPGAALVASVGVGAWALMPLAAAHRWPVPRLTPWLLSAAVVVACLQGAPNLEQALYWQTGMLTYLLPLVLMTLAAGWLVRRASRAAWPRWRDLLAIGALLFATAGLSETSAAVQLGVLPLSAVFVFFSVPPSRRRSVLVLLGSGWVATLIAAAILVAAPGNYRHEAQLTGSVHGLGQLPGAVQASVDFAGLFARTVEFRARLAVLVVLGLSIWFGMHAARAQAPAATPRDWLGRAARILGTVVCGWLLLVAAAIPGYFAQEFDPPERAQFVAVWVAVVCLASTGYLTGEVAGQLLRSRGARLDRLLASPVPTLACLVLALGSLSMIGSTLAQVPADVAYAADWDMLDLTIRTEAVSGGPVVVPRTLPMHYGFDFLTTDPAWYPNPCVARFYGIPSIRVQE
jgi:hypothetical protein